MGRHSVDCSPVGRIRVVRIRVGRTQADSEGACDLHVVDDGWACGRCVGGEDNADYRSTVRSTRERIRSLRMGCMKAYHHRPLRQRDSEGHSSTAN